MFPEWLGVRQVILEELDPMTETPLLCSRSILFSHCTGYRLLPTYTHTTPDPLPVLDDLPSWFPPKAGLVVAMPCESFRT